MAKNKKYLIHLLNNKISTVISILFYPIYLLLGFLRTVKLIKGKYNILSASSGNLINDNSKYLLLNYRNNNSFIYLVKDKNLLTYKSKYNLNIEYLYSIRALYFLVFAKNYFLSHGTFDVSPIFMKSVPVTQLWHGIPLKKIVNDVNRSNSIIKRVIFKLYPHLDYSYCDQLLTGGNECRLKYAFKKEDCDCLKIGFPRFLAFNSDFLFSNNDILQSADFNYVQKVKDEGKRVIVYAPTYRSYDDSNSIIEILKNLTDIEKSIIVYKGHAIGIKLEDELFKNKVYLYKEADPYPLMTLCDLLITDYSSLFIDFSVTKKPFILYMYDYEEYKTNVGLYFELDKEFCDIACFNQEQLLNRVHLFLNNPISFEVCKVVSERFLTNRNNSLFDSTKFEERFSINL